jgi:hypothetical protein
MARKPQRRPANRLSVGPGQLTRSESAPRSGVDLNRSESGGWAIYMPGLRAAERPVPAKQRHA